LILKLIGLIIENVKFINYIIVLLILYCDDYCLDVSEIEAGKSEVRFCPTPALLLLAACCLLLDTFLRLANLQTGKFKNR